MQSLNGGSMSSTNCRTLRTNWPPSVGAYYLARAHSRPLPHTNCACARSFPLSLSFLHFASHIHTRTPTAIQYRPASRVQAVRKRPLHREISGWYVSRLSPHILTIQHTGCKNLGSFLQSKNLGSFLTQDSSILFVD